MQAPRAVSDLVERFDTHRDAYKAPEYNETQVRHEFIDPMFQALGWDINNTKGYAEQWKEVVHEDSIKMGDTTRAPDYSFRLGGRRLFFLEAKKPAVNLKHDPSPAYQLRRYAWTAKLPLSILTDFEEFIVYDTRVRPAQNDKSSTARVLYIPYVEYPRRWDEIASIFSPDAIRQGAFDKYVASSRKKRGTAEVDDAFLAEIEQWRQLLARNIALRNHGLTQRELNVAVQSTIDRIIFLRICEDRGIENYAQLMALRSGGDVYARLRVLYERADERYNSGLFHFHKERDRPGQHDTLTPNLTIDDKVLKTIIKRLYYPESPYEFSVFPAEILGHVYERFLGSVIRLTAGGHAKVEQKPEVRKAGGVYYTPTYIVDYIVKHTVGKLLGGGEPGEGEAPSEPGEGEAPSEPGAAAEAGSDGASPSRHASSRAPMTPQEVAGLTDTWRPSKTRRPLAILDPACGSGSFLLGAYQYLLDWHVDYYSQGPKKWTRGKTPRVYQDRHGAYRLTTAERKRILLANIHGVDIDPQAVEVTKLSLLLKVLEGEDAETMGSQLELTHQRALPDLANNIKCGNSLIGPDFYQGKQLDAFDEEEAYRINAFDWNAEFPDIMSPPPDKGLQPLVSSHASSPGSPDKGLQPLVQPLDEPLIWFVTFVTHCSPVSERMVQFGVTDPEGKGLQPLVLTPEEQVLVAESLFDIAQRHGFTFVALNVLPDHVHAVLAALNEKVLATHVRNLKIFSAQLINKRRNRAKGSHVWAQKFNRKPVEDEASLARICDYILQNHQKHQETWGARLLDTWDKRLLPLVQRHCVDADIACNVETGPDKGLQPLVQPLVHDRAPGGFDVVIGNPPYIRIQTMKQWAPVEVEFYKERYRSAASGNYDIYVVFIEKGLGLLNENGRLGFICPHKFFNAKYGAHLRELIAQGRYLSEVIHFGDQQVFRGATTYTCLLFLDMPGASASRLVQVTDLQEWRASGAATEGLVKAGKVTGCDWNFVVGRGAGLFDKLSQMPVKLGDVAERTAQGIRTSANEVGSS